MRRRTTPKQRSHARLLGDVYIALNDTLAESGKSRQEVADDAGISVEVLSGILKGREPVEISELHDIAWAMGRRVAVRLEPLERGQAA